MQVVRVRMIEKGNEGCELAPVEVLRELREIGKVDVDRLNLEEIHVDLDSVEEAHHLILENSKEMFEMNDRVFFVGGDHSISYSTLRAFDKIVDNGLMIVFDAHGGCGDGLDDGWLRRLIDKGLNGRRVLLISTRSVNDRDLSYLKDEGVIVIGMDSLQEDLNDVCDIVMERALASGGFFVSVDIDSVDQSFAPGAANLEPGGLLSRELIYFVKRLSLLKNFKGAEIVNINPKKDVNGMTVRLGAKIFSEIL